MPESLGLKQPQRPTYQAPERINMRALMTAAMNVGVPPAEFNDLLSQAGVVNESERQAAIDQYNAELGAYKADVAGLKTRQDLALRKEKQAQDFGLGLARLDIDRMKAEKPQPFGQTEEGYRLGLAKDLATAEMGHETGIRKALISRDARLRTAKMARKGISQSDLDKIDEANLIHMAAKYGLGINADTGILSGTEHMDEAEKTAFLQEAEKLGLTAKLKEHVDKNWFSPDITTYTVSGLSGGRRMPTKADAETDQTMELGDRTEAPRRGRRTLGGLGTVGLDKKKGAVKTKPTTKATDDPDQFVKDNLERIKGGQPKPSTPEKTEVTDWLGEMDGLRVARSDQRGYVVLKNGKWEVPTDEEMRRIQVYIRKHGVADVRQDLSVRGRNVPAGGYYNPAHYRGLGR